MATINSAYTLRWESVFSSTNTREFYVAIYDRATTSSGPNSFEITDNGLAIQFDCDGAEKFSPIVGSKCILNFLVDLSSSAMQEWMDDLLGFSTITYVEGDIVILVRDTTSSGAILFCGEYLQDLDTLPDVSGIFPIQLTFTDGIGKLKEITFESKHVDTTADEYRIQGYQTFNYWIAEVLQHTKMYTNQAQTEGFWDDATDKIGFQTCVRWYNSEMYYAPTSSSKYGDPLQQTQGTMKWTDKTNPSNQQRNIANAYEVLKAICKSWGMRVIGWAGKWWFVQIREFNNPQIGTWQTPEDMPRYSYFASGDVNDFHESVGNTNVARFYNKIANISYPGERIQKLSGGKYKFLPVLNEVKLNLIHDGFQNLFGGIPEGDSFGTNAMNFIGGPFENSTNYKFKCNLMIVVTAPPTTQFVQTYDMHDLQIRIIALPAGSSSIGDGLATLTFDPSVTAYGWDDTPTYTGTDFGPVIHMHSLNGPYPGGGVTSTLPLGPNLLFPGYRNEPTEYMIMTFSQVIMVNQNGVQVNFTTGFPWGAPAAFSNWTNPVDSTAQNPPSWSVGFFNDFISTIQPVASTTPTTNTIFINKQTEDSHKIDWGDVYWGDGPEFWDDSALLVNTAPHTWEYSDWTSPDWERRSQTQSLHPAGSGEQFTFLLAREMKRGQATIIRRANFKLTVAEEGMNILGDPVFINAMGVIQDIYQKSNGVDAETTYFFRRGKYNCMTNTMEGEWIQTTDGTISGSSSQQKMAGGTNLVGTGGTQSAFMQQGASQKTSARVVLATATEVVVEDVAITSLDIEDYYETDVQDATDLPIGTAFTLKTGDTLYMVYDTGRSFELTLTADVTSESTSIEFSSITPNESSLTFPSFQIPMFKLYENMNRKTSGEIAGFDISATSLTKDGISIDGFVDSDSMSDASATTLATSESVKAYVDSSDGLVNYSRFTCTGTALSSATNGEAQAVVVPFDTEVESAVNEITGYGASGVTAVSDSEYCFGFGGTPPTGYFELTWNITTDTSVVNNRVLAGVKLQSGLVEGDAMTWTDVSGTHAYIYNRGSGYLREGSCSGGAVVLLSGDPAIYHRVVLWKEASSNGTSKAITVITGCQITIKEL
tara:strand:- start:5604 stop:8918 length:3315 start_codon:yes stop_codon:yes gene_type:complete